jgi:hypothetical protein
MSSLNDSTRPNNGRRIASAQAWKRLWNHELQQRAIAEALTSFPWDRQKQA